PPAGGSGSASGTLGSAGASSSVTIAQGPTAPKGYWYAITLRNFAPARPIAVSCSDSVDPGGFRTFTLTTDAAGNAFTQSACYSGDGPAHWVVAGGLTSARVQWGASTPPTSPGSTPSVSAANNGGQLAVQLSNFPLGTTYFFCHAG